MFLQTRFGNEVADSPLPFVVARHQRNGLTVSSGLAVTGMGGCEAPHLATLERTTLGPRPQRSAVPSNGRSFQKTRKRNLIDRINESSPCAPFHKWCVNIISVGRQKGDFERSSPPPLPQKFITSRSSSWNACPSRCTRSTAATELRTSPSCRRAGCGTRHRRMIRHPTSPDH